jgi:putative metal-binding protein
MYVANEGPADTGYVAVFDQQGSFLYSIPLPSGQQPRQMQISRSGILYVVSSVGNILKYDSQDQFIGTIGNVPLPSGLALTDTRIYLSGSEPGTFGQIYDFSGAAVGSFNFIGTAMTISDGQIWAADNPADEVQVADLDGNVLRSFSTGAGSKPRGIAIADDGLVYVARDLRNDVAVYDSQGTLIRNITSPALAGPYGLTFGPHGTIFVANFGANNVLEFDASGNLLSTLSGGLSTPNHIVFRVIDLDGDGSSWPTDCNDADPAAHQGAAEVCDGRDNDCDSQVDNAISCKNTCAFPEEAGNDILILEGPPGDIHTRMAWTGSQYGVVSPDARDGDSEIYFLRLDPEGVHLGEELRLTDVPGSSDQPEVVWTGTEFGVAWLDARSDPGGVIRQVYFARVSPTGIKLGTDIQVSAAANSKFAPSLVWNGSEYALTWGESTGPASSLLAFQRLTYLGEPKGEVVRLTSTPSFVNPKVTWSGSEYGLAWTHCSATSCQGYFVRLDPYGQKIGADLQLSNAPGDRGVDALIWTGSSFALAVTDWTDWHHDDGEIYLVRLDSGGSLVGQETRVTHSPTNSFLAKLTWTGSEFGLIWIEDLGVDDGDGGLQVNFGRVDSEGTKLDPDIRITDGSLGSLWTSQDLVWNGLRYAFVTQEPKGLSRRHFIQIACNCVDGDADGFTVCGDCDDTRGDTHPGAPEACDSVDNDCDGTPDAFQTVCGVGECSAIGFCSDGVDSCSTGLAQPEVCDGLDNDCNGRADDVDLDGDSASGCGADCNDHDPAIRPDALEVCNGLDDNCNSFVDEDTAGLDSDADTVPNACDNCRLAYNPTQMDADHDGMGNACDNCVFRANPGQADLDTDQRGDVCDNCPAQYNPFQDDFDADTVGDVCDNCPFDGNVDQGDIDSDFEGNVCDLDDGLIWITLPDVFTVSWQQEIGLDSWNIYRGDLEVLRASGLYTQDPAIVPLASRVCGVSEGSMLDDASLGPGEAVFFLVTGNALGVESSLGTNSAGVERANANPCP